MDRQLVHQQAVEWMVQRRWRHLWGKRGNAKKPSFTQSLLQHTDIELNALLTLMPILADKNHYDLSEHEQQTIIAGCIAHDVGKEKAAWQAYVQEQGPWVPHVIPSLTDEVVPRLVQVLGFDERIIPDVVACVNLHMASTRTPTNITGVLAGRSRNSHRWNTLARIVDTIDNISSISGLLATRAALLKDAHQGGWVSLHIRIAYHSVALRGVSTTLLHKAAERAYKAAGWDPLMYFSDGTIYVADSFASVEEPEVGAIERMLAEEIEQALKEVSFPKLVVGNPLETFVPKPDLFDYREVPQYLKQAMGRIRRGSFLKKPFTTRRDVVSKYLALADSQSADVDRQSERIDRAQPEMLAFKLFKSAVSSEIAGKIASLANPDKLVEVQRQRDERLELGADPSKTEAEYQRKLKKLLQEGEAAWERIVAKRYDAYFGNGAFARLQSTSTLMPAKEMAAIIDPFWALPGSVFGLLQTEVGFAPDDQRAVALLKILSSIVREAYDHLPESLRPNRATPLQLATVFVGDLVHPTPIQSLAELSRQQATAYTASKPRMLREGIAPRLCPICNAMFQRGTVASADFLDKPESHTNRAVAHGSPGRVIICDACKFERFLQQILLGERVKRVLVLMPRNHIGRWSGEELQRQANSFGEQARNLMSLDTNNPSEQVTLSLTNVMFRRLMSSDGGESNLLTALKERGLDAAELSSILRYRLQEKTQKEYRKALIKAIREEYELDEESEDVAILNEEWGSTYHTWDEAIDAVVSGRERNGILDEIRANTYRLRPQMRMVCQTPHLMLMPIASSFAVGKDSEANAALRELFVLLILGLALDCSVAAINPGDPLSFVGGEGVARVLAVPAIRDLIGSDWVSLTDAPIWLEKIGAASLLASATSYSERSNLYQILTATTKGHVLRRIELQQEGGYVSYQQTELIEKALLEVLHA